MIWGAAQADQSVPSSSSYACH